MATITLTYFSNKNEICLCFKELKSDKYTYSIYGNNGFVLKGLVETNLVQKPKVIFDIGDNTNLFVKLKEIDCSTVTETVKFVNIDHLKQKNNLNMFIVDKDTDTLFKSITEESQSNQMSANSSSNQNIDMILNSIKLEASDNSNTSDSENDSNSDNDNQSQSYTLKSIKLLNDEIDVIEEKNNNENIELYDGPTDGSEDDEN